MPIREYKCTRCGFIRERIELGKKKRTNPLCPMCGNKTDIYLSTKVNFNLTGDGWYSGGFNGEGK